MERLVDQHVRRGAGVPVSRLVELRHAQADGSIAGMSPCQRPAIRAWRRHRPIGEAESAEHPFAGPARLREDVLQQTPGAVPEVAQHFPAGRSRDLFFRRRKSAIQGSPGPGMQRCPRERRDDQDVGHLGPRQGPKRAEKKDRSERGKPTGTTHDRGYERSAAGSARRPCRRDVRPADLEGK